MENWIGKIALVTGSSAGIGRAICEELVKHGLIVIACARRMEKLNELKSELSAMKGKLVPYECDVTKDIQVEEMFAFINKNYDGLDICINNAGTSIKSGLLDGTTEEWRMLSNINVIALCLCTKLAVASMTNKEVNHGFIINISSNSAHVVYKNPSLHFYTGTKYAVKAITEGLRQELKVKNPKIRVATISPGLVMSELVEKSIKGHPVERLIEKGLLVPMTTEDVAQSVIYILSQPERVEINDIHFTPTIGSVG